jgi:DNA repair protein RecO (recombination protein O)
MIISTEAIVLNSLDFRETSKIVTFFTKDHGKVKGILKGIRKDPKKFGSTADKFSINDIVYYWHRNSEIHLVSQCDVKAFFPGVRDDLKKTMAAGYMLELINVVMPLEEKNEDVYGLITNFLQSLQETRNVNKLVHILQIKTLLFSGFQPHLDSCLKCEEKIQGRARFSLASGGLYCRSCQPKDAVFTDISQGAVASILHIEKGSWDQCLRLSLVESIQKELKYILNNFLVFHLEKNLLSAKYV